MTGDGPTHKGMAGPGERRFSLRPLKSGKAEGPLLTTREPISFYGGMDLDTGVVTEAGHPLQGRCVAGAILCFPTGKGSTVGSYAIYRLARAGLAPAALIMSSAEPIVVTGAILAQLPCADGLDPGDAEGFDRGRLEGAKLIVEKATNSRNE